MSLILQQAVRTVFGARDKQVYSPPFLSGAFHVGGLEITQNRLWIIVLSGMVFAMLLFVLRATSFGLQMRAVTQNRRMASAMGISTTRVDMLAFALGSGVAGIAGVALSQIDNVSPNLGQGYIIDSFMVVVFGGVGNLWGAALGALTLGLANKILERSSPPCRGRSSCWSSSSCSSRNGRAACSPKRVGRWSNEPPTRRRRLDLRRHHGVGGRARARRHAGDAGYRGPAHADLSGPVVR